MKKFYDRNSARCDIKEGDWVVLKKQPRRNALSPLFDGPWMVVKRVGSNVHLRNHERGTIRIVHLNKCKKIPHYGGGYTNGETDWCSEEDTEEDRSEEKEEEERLGEIEHQGGKSRVTGEPRSRVKNKSR